MNRRFLLLFLLAVGNLLLMHWQLALTVEYEYPFRPDAVWSNVFACLIDTTVFFPVGLLVTWGRVKPALLITFVGTWLLALFNLVYARFFDHYIPTMAVTQIGNLMDGQVAKCTFFPVIRPNIASQKACQRPSGIRRNLEKSLR